ncbi:MAG: GNAT family N-acetyltransferase [Chitinophagales bacterium]|nr:GNAT family N-acetyltransferase [Chitinophagales bacterium]
MNIEIRTAKESDIPSILSLIKELALYEKAPLEVETTVESMMKDGFGKEAIYHSQIAIADNIIVGCAVYYIGYSTWKGKMIYLDDIIVTESMRRFGIGKKLFDAVGKFAKESGANHFRWHVLDWNEPAINFYKKIGASLNSEWILCKMNKQQIEKLF